IRSASRTTWPSSVAGKLSSVSRSVLCRSASPLLCVPTPSRTSHVRFSPRADFQNLHHPEALGVMPEAAHRLNRLIERLLAGMPKGRMPQIVGEGDCLGEILIQAQRPRGGPRDLGDFQRVGQARAVVVSFGGDEHLRLVGEPTKRLAVDNAIAVALKTGAQVVLRFGGLPAARGLGQGGPRAEALPFPLFGELARRTRHRTGRANATGAARLRRRCGSHVLSLRRVRHTSFATASFSLIRACAAASWATGTRNGEHDT